VPDRNYTAHPGFIELTHRIQILRSGLTLLPVILAALLVAGRAPKQNVPPTSAFRTPRAAPVLPPLTIRQGHATAVHPAAP